MNLALYLRKSGCGSALVSVAKYIQQSFCCSWQNTNKTC